MEVQIKHKTKQAQLIKFLIDSKNEMLKESEEYLKSSSFKADMKKLKLKQKQNNGLQLSKK